METTKFLKFIRNIQVKHISAAATDEDSWCWEQNNIDLDVGTQDVKGVVFVQKGYWVTIVSTHNTEAQIEQPDSSRVNLMIKVTFLLILSIFSEEKKLKHDIQDLF